MNRCHHKCTDNQNIPGRRRRFREAKNREGFERAQGSVHSHVIEKSAPKGKEKRDPPGAWGGPSRGLETSGGLETSRWSRDAIIKKTATSYLYWAGGGAP